MTKLLILEDDPNMVLLLRNQLGDTYDLIDTTDVAQGWQMLVEQQPDGAIVDLTLYGASGWVFVERAREDPRYNTLPIVILTGAADEGVIARAGALDCAVVGKPFAASGLKARIADQIAAAAKKVPEAGRQELVRVGVVLLLDRYLIEGNIYMAPELSRFSDAWESLLRDKRSYIPLTDVTIMATDGSQFTAGAPFVQVGKADVRAAYPKESI